MNQQELDDIKIKLSRNGEPEKETDVFFCNKQQKYVYLGECIEDYVNATALNYSGSSCCRCAKGHSRRKAFSKT